MARFGIFEDSQAFRDMAQDQLVTHQLVEEAVATTLGQAFDVLRSLAAKQVSIDFLLLDGTLAADPQPAVFRYTQPPLDAEANAPEKMRRKGLFGRRTPAVTETVISRDDFRTPCKDAKAIGQVIDVLGLDIPIIGISSDGLFNRGIPLLDDVLKEDFDQLAQVVGQYFE